MEQLAKADIFFFVTTIVIATWGVLFAVALVYLITIMRRIKRLVERAHRELESVADDFGEIREDIKAGVKTTTRYAQNAVTGFSVGKIVSFLISTVSEARAKKSRTRSRKAPSEGEE